eukprot:145844-Rhodomonas_salina.1
MHSTSVPNVYMVSVVPSASGYTPEQRRRPPAAGVPATRAASRPGTTRSVPLRRSAVPDMAWDSTVRTRCVSTGYAKGQYRTGRRETLCQYQG